MKSALVIFVISINVYKQAAYANSYLNPYVKYLEEHNLLDISCKLVHQEWKRNMNNANCKLRETLVKIQLNDNHNSYNPDHVLVKRCIGTSLSPNVCIPKEVKMREFVVKRNMFHKIPSCHVVQVEEHTKCRLGCGVMKNDCNEKQTYMEDSCKCVCMDTEQMNKCKDTKDMMWDEKECACKCNYIEPCATGNVWVPEMCKCIRLKYDHGYVGIITRDY